MNDGRQYESDMDPDEIKQWLMDEIDWYINDSPNSSRFRSVLREVNPKLADNDTKLKKHMFEMLKEGTLAMLSNPLSGEYTFVVLHDDGHWKTI